MSKIYFVFVMVFVCFMACNKSSKDSVIVKEKEVITEKKQEIVLDLDKTYFQKTYKEYNGKLVVELKVGEYFDFNGDLFLSKNYFPNHIGAQRIKLIKADSSGYEFFITNNAFYVMPLQDGRFKFMENSFRENTGHKVTLKEGEKKLLSSLWIVDFEVIGENGGHFKVEISRHYDELFQNKKGKKIVQVNEGFYSTGGTKSYCLDYHCVVSEYETNDDKFSLIRQVVSFREGLDFSTEDTKENKFHINDWLKKNSFVMIFGKKFTVEYLTEDYSKPFSGVFRLTDSKNSRNIIYVTAKKTFFNFDDELYESHHKGVELNSKKMKEYNTPYKGILYSDVLQIVSSGGKITKWKIRAFTGRTVDGLYVTSTGPGPVVMNYEEIRGFELIKLQ